MLARIQLTPTAPLDGKQHSTALVAEPLLRPQSGSTAPRAEQVFSSTQAPPWSSPIARLAVLSTNQREGGDPVVANPIARRGNVVRLKAIVVRLKAIARRGCTLGVEELVTVGQTGP